MDGLDQWRLLNFANLWDSPFWLMRLLKPTALACQMPARPGVVGDIHDPAHGLKVLERYKELGIGESAELVHSLSDTKDNQVMQFLPEFVRKLVTQK